jgi:hypothetical protein
MKTLSSQLADDTKQLGGILGGLVGGLLPNSPQCVYNNNCQFLGLNLYVVIYPRSLLFAGMKSAPETPSALISLTIQSQRNVSFTKRQERVADGPL